MHKPLRVAVVGLGRMGAIHTRHVFEGGQETGHCALAALCDSHPGRAQQLAAELGCTVPVFGSVEELAEAGVADASVVAILTGKHGEHARALIAAGQHVLLEKPLTGALALDLALVAELDNGHPHAVMMALQHRFDAALEFADQLVNRGAIGRVFKIYSALEDSSPAPDNFQSEGILPDMSIHNVHEVLWHTGKMPSAATMIGNRIYSHRLTKCGEDFDDA